jgi:UDP-N-acetylglucosamine acyltransferase
MQIHPTAVVDSDARVGEGTEIGPYVVIDGPVSLGRSNWIGPGAIITGKVTIGDENKIHGHVYIGNVPQDISYDGSCTGVEIGSGNILREFTNIHRGTKEGTSTIVGDNNYLMVGTHIAHNCVIGSNVFMVNGASLGGYCEVHDGAFMSAYVIVHQFVRIGSYSITGILSKITKDVPPYMMVDGNPATVRGINTVGLRRNGFSPERRTVIKRAYRLMYRSNMILRDSTAQLRELSETTQSEESSGDIRGLIEFIESSKRGIIMKSAGNDGGSG